MARRQKPQQSRHDKKVREVARELEGQGWQSKLTFRGTMSLIPLVRTGSSRM